MHTLSLELTACLLQFQLFFMWKIGFRQNCLSVFYFLLPAFRSAHTRRRLSSQSMFQEVTRFSRLGVQTLPILFAVPFLKIKSFFQDRVQFNFSTTTPKLWHKLPPYKGIWNRSLGVITERFDRINTSCFNEAEKQKNDIFHHIVNADFTFHRKKNEKSSLMSPPAHTCIFFVCLPSHKLFSINKWRCYRKSFEENGLILQDNRKNPKHR